MASILHSPRENQQRTLDHNARFHSMCRDIAKHVVWGGRKWADEEWKRLMLGAKFGQPVVQSPFGCGFVVVNAKRSRELTNAEMEELLGEMQAFGDEHGVDWSEDDSSR
jgi:sugar phosphate isomerase/epimerase